MTTKLPKKLNKEPLIDALFEVRFTSTFPASGILPGFLFGKLDGDKTIETLPLSQLPQALRDADPNLQFAPLNRLNWRPFFVTVGDRSLSIGCTLPYPGWIRFKDAIAKIMEILNDANIVQSIERYSMKYVDLIPFSELRQQISSINCDLTIAGHNLKEESFQLRIEVPKDGFINAVQIASAATVSLVGNGTREGLIVDVDTIANLPTADPLQKFLEGFSDKLEAIHTTNKKMFFDCLKQETIDALEPVYE